MFTSQEILFRIEEALKAVQYPSQPEGLYEPISYVLSMGGKRIRPVLLLMAYNLYREDIDFAVPAAVGLETYHNYTLLHDDLMDRADVRRGKPTVHKVWDDNTAILSGDTMLVLAYRHILSLQRSDSLKLFTQTALEIGEGQQYDMNFETRYDVTEAEYIEMIRLKTSVLLACAAKMGAMLANADEKDQNLLYSFGESIGLAFQLQDDFLDVYGDPLIFGKKIGGDILCNKKTYLLINAYLRADAEQKKTLDYWLSAKDYDPNEKIKAVTALYNALGVKEASRQKVEAYFEEGLNFLAQVNLPEVNKVELARFAESLMNRQS